MSQVRVEPTEVDLEALKEAVGFLREYPLKFTVLECVAELMVKQFEAWIWMGDLGVDHLDRACWPETIRLAEEINRIGKELT